MDGLLLIKAALMGLVEGFTEFLPISSTGHLILASDLLNFAGPNFGTDKVQAFEIIIQAGAILAVCWEYRARILATLAGFPGKETSRRLILNLVIAFIPAAALGFLFSKAIKSVLFAPVPVALAFIIGGLIILWVERPSARQSGPARIESVDDMRWPDALKIGVAQAFALIPGTSRSGATIIGGMLFGLSRKAATEFSFFLAIPTLFAATAYSAIKERASFVAADAPVFAVGLITSFISAFLCVRWLLRYISSHDFTAFAWYRIAFGLIVLGTAWGGLLAWKV